MMNGGDPPKCFADLCQSGGCGGMNGWTAKYDRTPRTWWPYVHVFVTDLAEGATFSGWLKFLVDTGATWTVIPRRILSEDAFRRRPGEDNESMGGGTGDPMYGRRFDAGLSLTPDHPNCQPLIFRPVRLFVPDKFRPIQHGFLGRDALEQIITCFDHERVVFRRRVGSREA